MEINNIQIPDKVVEKAYDDVLSKPANSVGNALTTVIDFFNNTVLYPMKKYNLYAEEKLKNYEKNLEERAKKIPVNQLSTPRVNIIGPTIEGLKYNLDEDYIKDLFTNILLSEMKKTKQSKVLPSYIEIVKQLSKDDAEFLFEIKNNMQGDFKFPMIRLKLNYDNDEGYTYIGNYYINLNNNCEMIDQTILDNLLRLKIFNIPNDEFISDEQIYKDIFNKIIEKNFQYDKENINYNKYILEITEFGRNFIKICMEEN